MKKIDMMGPWITEHEIRTVDDAMRDWYDEPYKYCEAFQKEFAEFHSRKHALMTPNCTSAIHLLLTALGIKEGDEVILPECTWIATGAGITYLGATPVFCDIDPVDWCLDPDSVKKSITTRTKAIIVVDLFGNMPRMDELHAISNDHKIPLIEDAAEALGSKYRGIRAGKFGIGSVFSFHRTKTLVTGEGGMLLLDDDALFERCAFLRDHGRKPDGEMYYNYEVTYKYMPFNIQAAIGYAQLQRIEELIEKKRWIFSKYKEGLAELNDIQLNAEPEHIYNGVWSTVMVIGEKYNLTRQDFISLMAKNEIPLRPFFYPLSSLPAYPNMQAICQPKNPHAYNISPRGINLPGALNLTEDQIEHVCINIKKNLRS